MGQRGEERVKKENTVFVDTPFIARTNSKGDAKDSIGGKRIPYWKNIIWTIDMRCLCYLANKLW